MTDTRALPHAATHLPMGGLIAGWYSRARQDLEAQADIEHICGLTQPGDYILEIAPGPGHICLALAERGYRVTGLDISASFLKIAYQRARSQGQRVTWVLGDAADLPFDDEQFHLTVCRAAFKNFTAPEQAINEMHRVLKPAGTALIFDLWGEASPRAVKEYVATMPLRGLDRWMTERSLTGFLLKNAYSIPALHDLITRSPFTDADIAVFKGVGMQVTLRK